MEKIIYLDNAATTRVYPEVLEAMNPFFTEHFANPAAFYSFANPAQKAVHEAREQVAKLIGAKNEEIYFTGGGSESDDREIRAILAVDLLDKRAAAFLVHLGKKITGASRYRNAEAEEIIINCLTRRTHLRRSVHKLGGKNAALVHLEIR